MIFLTHMFFFCLVSRVSVIWLWGTLLRHEVLNTETKNYPKPRLLADGKVHDDRLPGTRALRPGPRVSRVKVR